MLAGNLRIVFEFRINPVPETGGCLQRLKLSASARMAARSGVV
jgi:hypothetical protein